jgi:glycosyltransferase involved in cell wall biosynthesis
LKSIAIVYNSSWYIFNFRMNLARAFKEEGYKVIAIAPRDDYSEKLIEIDFDEYHDLKMNNSGMNPIEDLRMLVDLIKIYKHLKPDVICHYTIKPNIYGTVAASICGIPAINNIAGLGTLFVKKSFMTTVVKMLYKFSQARAYKVLFQNQDDCDMFLSEGLVDKSKIDRLPGSGVDLKKFHPIKNIDKKNGKIHLLLIARMIWDKGVGEYVEAARIIKQKYDNVEFQLLGSLDADNRTAISKLQMEQWVDEGIVNYLGVTDTVTDYISKADCIVLPSFYREGVPRVLIEAAAMAKPIVTTNNVGCKDVVDDSVNGFLCEVRNSKELANCIEKIILMSSEERATMGAHGRAKAKRVFDEKIVINKYLEVTKGIV